MSTERTPGGPWFRNIYHCSKCFVIWEDECSTTCGDECPKCHRTYEPTRSIDFTAGALPGSGIGASVDMPQPPKNFREALARVINCYSKENGSNTPDFILADYLDSCLLAFDRVYMRRQKWYNDDAGEITRPPKDHSGNLPPQPLD